MADRVAPESIATHNVSAHYDERLYGDIKWKTLLEKNLED